MIKINLLKNDKAAKRFLNGRKRNKDYRDRHPGRTVESARAWREKDPEHAKELNRERSKRFRENNLRLVKEREKDNKKRRAYGITQAEFEGLVAAQGNLCLICAGPPTGRWKVLAIDHDHDTGVVRGLLCHYCNMGIGQFKDSPELLEAAAAYLRKHKAKQDDKAA